ncbi:MAG: Fe-S cluster assembly protein SufD [Pyrinomonadaceae bacterium]|nr:Fe-S cluster assembly protein SufD [Pyrinomonadaceae bacterium]
MTQTVKETIYNYEFRRSLESANQPIWLKNLREKSFRYFTENGFPVVQSEEWKYTNIAPMAKENFLLAELSETAADEIRAKNLEVEIDAAPAASKTAAFVFDESKRSVLIFNNGVFDKGASKLDDLQSAEVLSFSEAAADQRYAEIFKTRLGSLVDSEKNGFTALNTAFIGDGVFIYLPKNAKINQPVQLLFLTDEGKVSFPRVLIVAESFAEATIIETYNRSGETKYLTNAVVEISVADEAKIKHFRVQRESHSAFHISTTAAEVGRGSVYDTTAINLGAKLSRHDVSLKFNAEGGEAFVDGLYFLGESQHHDTHSIISHNVPNCTSHQTYKGILNDKSRGVFNGKVFVAVGASGTDGYQSNKNLLLSNEARVDTKPQLEIFNDDVKCSHGATVGQLEEEELFYLLSRGLNETLARNLLTYGFAEEIVNKIGIESIKKQLDEAVLNRLNTSLEA